MSTLTELATRAQERFQDPNSRAFTLAQWKAYVNEAYDDTLTAHAQWPFLESRNTSLSVTAGGNTVQLPTGVWKVLDVYNETDDIGLEPLDGRHHHPHDTLGTPQFYRIRGSTLEVFPAASSTTSLTIDLLTPPVALTDAAEPVFPRPYHKLLVEGALAFAFDDDGHVEQGQLHRTRFEQGVQRMASDLLGPQTGQYPGIVDNFGL